MNKITKETIKRIKEGYHDDLMEAIEFLLDSYDDDKYTMGYTACLFDLSVRSYRLAEHIHKVAEKKGAVATIVGDKDFIHVLDVDETAKVIEDYYTNALKQ